MNISIKLNCQNKDKLFSDLKKSKLFLKLSNPHQIIFDIALEDCDTNAASFTIYKLNNNIESICKNIHNSTSSFIIYGNLASEKFEKSISLTNKKRNDLQNLEIVDLEFKIDVICFFH